MTIQSFDRCRRTAYGVLAGAGLLISVFLTGCSDDLGMGYGGDLGEKKQATVTVSFGGETPSVASRSVDFSQNAMVKIDSYWVGLFDTQTGELIGSKSDPAPRKGDGSRYTIYNGDGTPFTVEDVDIFYYDKNPEAYIVGVVNYNGVTAKLAGEPSEKNLEDILEGIRNFDEVCKIVVNTESMDRANPAESNGLSPMPLMMGYYSTDALSVHTTVSNSGTINDENANAVRIRLASSSDNHSSMKLPSGAIRLQRLISEMNFSIQGGRHVTIHSVEYIVCNNPADMFLAEHTTDGNGGTTSDRNTYLSNTANSADYYNGSEGYMSDSYYRAANEENGVFTLSYQNYENKHWGRKWNFPYGYDQNSHLVRETLYEDKNSETGKSDVYRTLCQYADAPWNNNASYVVLKVNATFEGYEYYERPDDPNDGPYYGPEPGPEPGPEGDGYGSWGSITATVYYTIHEGSVARPNGAANTADSRGYDYQRIRNTAYFYNITINGLNELVNNAYATVIPDGMPADIPPHNDGITGEAWGTFLEEVDPSGDEDSYSLNMNLFTPELFKSLKWRLMSRSPEGENNYGTWQRTPEMPNNFPAWPSFPESELPNLNVPQELLDDIIVRYYGANPRSPYDYTEMTFQDIIDGINESRAEFELPYFFIAFSWKQFNAPDLTLADKYRRALYLCYDFEEGDADGCITPEFVYGFEQNSRDLPIFEGTVTAIAGGTYNSTHGQYAYNGEWCSAPYLCANIEWRTAYMYNGSGYDEATSYILQVDDLPEVEIRADSKYRYQGGSSGPYVSYPYPVGGLSVGTHTVAITPVGDPTKYKPGTTQYFTLDLGRDAYWTFDNSDTPFRWYISSGYTTHTEFYGLTMVSGNGFASISSSDLNSAKYIDTQGTGNFNSRSFQLTIDRPGYITVEAYNTNANETPERGIYVESQNGSKTFEKYTQGEGVKSHRFEITEDDLLKEDGIVSPTVFAIYAKERMYLYSIRFTPLNR